MSGVDRVAFSIARSPQSTSRPLLLLVRHRWAALLPAVAAAILLSLTEITRQIAVGAGHCETIVNGTVVRVDIPPISPATRLSSERWIWTLGVDLTWLILLVPSFFMGWEVFRPAQHFRFGAFGCPMNKLCFALLLVGSVFLVGEATIPLQVDVMDPKAHLTMQSETHLFCAGIMFLCLLLHGGILTLWQCCLPAGQRIFGKASMIAKVCIVGLTLLSLSGVIPIALIMICPPVDREPAEVLLMNLGGLSQRCIVACIAFYLASYSLDLYALRHRVLAQSMRGEDAAGQFISLSAA
mmetsp:Transcript_37445/g.85119  ORF Transcript_37445/g.85119 Transcript_37445/m.85119 type:complete len:296 (-) Transcript_37445:41-928(-)